MRGPPRVLVVVPTTGGPLLLRRLAPRPGLPHPAAFAEGHYRPLALSADYRALAGPEGPVARHLGAPLQSHELRLSGEPDGGRSWEAPVALAHLLLARGGALASGPEEADLVLWATGAVDLDLRLLSGDYALGRKVEASRPLLEAAGERRAVAVLPPGDGGQEATAALGALRRAVPVEVVRAESLGEVATWLGEPAREVASPRDVAGVTAARRARAATLRWMAGVAVAAAAAAWLLWPAGPVVDADARLASVGAVGEPGRVETSPEPSEAAAPADPEPQPDAPPEEPVGEPTGSEPAIPEPTAVGPERQAVDPPIPAASIADPLPVGTPPSDTGPEAPPTQEDLAADAPAPDPLVTEPLAPDPPAPAALIEEVRAAPGSSCRAALFDPGARVLSPVPREGAGYAPLSLDPGLCGVALRPGTAGAALGPVAADPPDAFVAAPAGDGSTVLFLRGAARNVVYAVPVVTADGEPVTVEHRLVAPDASTE